MTKKLSFQDIIFNLQNYWSEAGCAILQPIDIEVGAGTLHPATILQSLIRKNWNIAYVQPCRRPTDSRYGDNPNRLGSYYQFQAILKPAPDNIKELFLKSLTAIGIDIKNNDIRFVEDDWENPTVGASGLGWEVWYNGMEITQFTYMQQIGGIECSTIPVEITYGLERIAMHIQDIDNIFDINWNNGEGVDKITYRDIFLETERQNSSYILEHSNKNILLQNFTECEVEANNLISNNLPIPAYEKALKASHILNLLDARGIISEKERVSYITRVRSMVKASCNCLVKN